MITVSSNAEQQIFKAVMQPNILHIPLLYPTPQSQALYEM